MKIYTDEYFYDYINSLSDDKICFLVPNHITIINFIFSIYIIFAIYKKKHNLPILLLFIFIRSCLDNLDGAVARKCKKTSELGKYLDVFSDTIYIILLLFLLYINIKSKYIWMKNIIPVIILIFIYGSVNAIFYDYEVYKHNLGKLLYGNTILINTISFVIYYNLLN